MKNTLVVATVTFILLVGGACRGHDYNLIRANRWNSPSDMRTWWRVHDSMTSSPETWYAGLRRTGPAHRQGGGGGREGSSAAQEGPSRG
jgi:hypothetical protein